MSNFEFDRVGSGDIDFDGTASVAFGKLVTGFCTALRRFALVSHPMIPRSSSIQ